MAGGEDGPHPLAPTPGVTPSSGWPWDDGGGRDDETIGRASEDWSAQPCSWGLKHNIPDRGGLDEANMASTLHPPPAMHMGL